MIVKFKGGFDPYTTKAHPKREYVPDKYTTAITETNDPILRLQENGNIVSGQFMHLSQVPTKTVFENVETGEEITVDQLREMFA